MINSLITTLFLIPVITGAMILILPKVLSKALVIASSVVLAFLSVYIYLQLSPGAKHFTVPYSINDIVSVADILLLLYFGWIGFRKKSLLVAVMTILQLGTLLYLLKTSGADHTPQFMVDRLSGFMFLLINVISGIIAVYSIRYIEDENCSAFKKKFFLALIFWFISVMDLVVSSDNLEYFFLFFELTTLASYLFIAFRRDNESVQNALTALWMNQIGGMAILVAIFFINYDGFGAATFSNLLAHTGAKTLLLPLALMSMAALIKGAQMPFSKWLLGAMVAPTPVSALLHSSTMVKIAPFIILRLSPALKGTPVAMVLIVLTGFVFVASAISALSQDNFKRILAHSTIALLALMIMTGALATPVTIVASLMLIFFHGISKCMLFLNAGVLERVFHLKQSSDMDHLGETGPFTSMAITIGLMSLLLPPFGAFIGKWFSIETLGDFATTKNLLGALVLVAIAGGGAVLSLLYFKVMGVLIARTGSNDRMEFERTGTTFKSIIYILLVFIVLGVLGLPLLTSDYFAPVASQVMGKPLAVFIDGWNMHIGIMKLPMLPLLIAFLLLPGTIVATMFIHFKNVDRAKEYMCGEKVDYSFSSLYFSTDRAAPYFLITGVLFFAALIVVAVV